VKIMHCAILSRLLILRYCINKASTFSKQRWLLIQICQNIFGELYNYNFDIFLSLMLELDNCTTSSVTTCIGNIYQEISNNNKFIIILDETQVLENLLEGKFRS